MINFKGTDDGDFIGYTTLNGTPIRVELTALGNETIIVEIIDISNPEINLSLFKKELIFSDLGKARNVAEAWIASNSDASVVASKKASVEFTPHQLGIIEDAANLALKTNFYIEIESADFLPADLVDDMYMFTIANEWEGDTGWTGYIHYEDDEAEENSQPFNAPTAVECMQNMVDFCLNGRTAKKASVPLTFDDFTSNSAGNKLITQINGYKVVIENLIDDSLSCKIYTGGNLIASTPDCQAPEYLSEAGRSLDNAINIVNAYLSTKTASKKLMPAKHSSTTCNLTDANGIHFNQGDKLIDTETSSAGLTVGNCYPDYFIALTSTGAGYETVDTQEKASLYQIVGSAVASKKQAYSKNMWITVPAGTYYLGDPCYTVIDSAWLGLLNTCNTFIDNAIGTLPDGKKVYSFGTAYGDGAYKISGTSIVLGVDAGMIGLTPADSAFVQPSKDSILVTFNTDVKGSYEDGIITFGQYEINTN